MPVFAHETGLAPGDDRVLHAAKPGLAGKTALCGAGQIIRVVPGRFDTDDPRSCRDCCRALDKPANR